MTNDTSEDFTIARAFHAPRELVFSAWTEADKLEQWWGPKDSPIKVEKFDLRPGGIFLYSMQLPNSDQKWWARFVYQEIVPTSKLVFISSFSDENGNVTRAPFSNTFPLEILNTVNFNLTGGTTTLVLQGGPINATEEEKQFYASMNESMQQGFAGTFNQLEAYLANIVRDPSNNL